MTETETENQPELSHLKGLDTMTLQELDAERTLLLGNHATLDELTVEQLERLIEINAKITNVVRVAAKPKAAKKQEVPLEDLLNL